MSVRRVVTGKVPGKIEDRIRGRHAQKPRVQEYSWAIGGARLVNVCSARRCLSMART